MLTYFHEAPGKRSLKKASTQHAQTMMNSNLAKFVLVHGALYRLAEELWPIRYG